MQMHRITQEHVSGIELRRRAKALEYEIKLDLDKYSSLENARREVIQDSFKRTQELLEQLSEVVSRLYDQSLPMRGDGAPALHEENLKNYTRIFSMIKDSIHSKEDVDETFKSTNTLNPDEFSVTIQRLFNDEESLQKSNMKISQVIKTGEEVKRIILNGTVAMTEASNRIQEVLSMSSKFESALRAIKRAKLKSTVIIGLLISTCLCILFLML